MPNSTPDDATVLAIDAAVAESVPLAIAAIDQSPHEAQAALTAVLALRPRHAAANYHLGRLRLRDGDPQDALAYLLIAGEEDPANGQIWLAVADCLRQQQRYDEARQVLQTACAAGLDDPQAQVLWQSLPTGSSPASAPMAASDSTSRLQTLLGKRYRRHAARKSSSSAASAALTTLLGQGDWPALLDSALQSLEHQPDRAKDWDLLGIAYLQLGQPAAARLALQRAAQLLPTDAEIWDHLGVAERLTANLGAAAQAFERSLAIDSRRPETWINFGNLQSDLRQPGAALTSFQRALALNPDSAEAIGSVGSALRDLGQFAEAARYCQDLVDRRPDLAEGHCNLGNVQRDLGRYDEAIASYRQALALKPLLAEAHSGLGRALIDRGQIEEALSCYQQALAIRPDFLEAHSNLLKTLNHLGNHSPADCLQAARRFGEQAARRVDHPFRHQATPAAGAPLRVGLVSGDLRQHPVGYFLDNVVAEIDPTVVELHAYATHDAEDALSSRLRRHVAGWTSLSRLTDQEAARRIHADGIQALIDLSGHTAHSRLPLFAWRPAPLQVSWLGYFATTGLSEMDFLLADPQVVPPGEEHHFSEAVWRLPETYLCFTPPEVDISVNPLPALASGVVTFGCFNNLNKLNDHVLEVWAAILRALPEAKLLLKTASLGEETACEILRRRFHDLAVNADRLVLEGHSPRADLLAAYQRVDIALDPFPYPGGTTSVEALWMGVPVITRRGDRFLSHVGETVAVNAGLADWIAADDQRYVELALEHAADLPALAILRAGLRRRLLDSPLFDARRFARHFEAALFGMWQARQHALRNVK
ncbi:MAG: tetratricopeptide repeat protein [Candidatus Accumulibacter sp.]|nr:tetratricopeptide repeat protein [Accumulibacter sp.]